MKMVSFKVYALTILLSLSVFDVGFARIWTDKKNRKIEAKLLRVEGNKIVLERKGKEVKVAISKLSEGDQQYIKEWQEENDEGDDNREESNSGEITVCGKVLKPNGVINVVEEAANAKVMKAYSKAAPDRKPTKVKIAIALPKGFDPSKPQHVMWISAAINSDAERKAGNLAAIHAYAKAGTDAGWVVIAADTDQGNPRLEDNQQSDGGDLAVHTQAIQAITKAWPKFSTWKFACCGHSGGGKASFSRVGQLLASNLNVIGLFLSGCNQDMTAMARKEARFKKSSLRKIKVWISNGKKDTISNVGHAESLEKSIKSNRYGKIRLELFDGGHVIHYPDFTRSMKWFSADEE